MAKGEKINKKTARKWIKNYEKKHRGDKNYLSSMHFHKKIVMDMLNEESCVGLRIYNAMDDEGKLHFILVGTDAQGKNILPAEDDYVAARSTVDSSDGGEPILINNGFPCPPHCPDDII
ncbi:MAG: hypothetical protein EBR30_23970 [Cytophagia bacterium]|nr:hypothetical protein [Cytophagia bacterium]